MAALSHFKPTFTDENKARKIGSLIAAHFGEDWGKGVYHRDGDKLDVEDKKNMTIGVLLKMDTDSLKKFVNDERKARGLEEIVIDKRDVYDHRHLYADAIDQSYIATAMYIGEVHPYADKLHRIGILNDIVESLKGTIPMLSYSDEDVVVKKANLLIKTLGAIQVEMGGKTLLDFFVPDDKKKKKKLSEDDEKEFSKEEAEKLLTEQFSAQLPAQVSRKIDYTDYRNCANGELLGGNIVCWNDKMRQQCGEQCGVQSGKIQNCPKFLNKNLLDNKEFLLRAKERRLTWADIAVLLGAEKIDEDIKERMRFFYVKHNVKELLDGRKSSNYGATEETEVSGEETGEIGS